MQAPPFIANGGGENSFLGRTRSEDNSEHGPLVLLRYEAKQSMALKELDKVARPLAPKGILRNVLNAAPPANRGCRPGLAWPYRYAAVPDACAAAVLPAGTRSCKQVRAGLCANPTLARRCCHCSGLGACPGLPHPHSVGWLDRITDQKTIIGACATCKLALEPENSFAGPHRYADISTGMPMDVHLNHSFFARRGRALRTSNKAQTHSIGTVTSLNAP